MNVFSVFNENIIFVYGQIKHFSLTTWAFFLFFFFKKEPKYTPSQNPSVCQMSTTAADKDSGNLESVPRSASHLMYSLVQFLLSLLVSLLSFAFFPCQWNFFRVEFLSTMCLHSIYCTWIPSFIWTSKLYCFRSSFLKWPCACIWRKRRIVEMRLLPLLRRCFRSPSVSC